MGRESIAVLYFIQTLCTFNTVLTLPNNHESADIFYSEIS
jgi:hypothetical protein